MNLGPTPLRPSARLQRDPLAVIAIPLAPIVLEGRYRLLVGALCLSLVMLGLLDSVALAPLAFAAALFPGAGMAMRAALAVVAAAGVAAAALILVLPRLAASRRALRFRLGRWLSPRTTSRRAAAQSWALVSA